MGLQGRVQFFLSVWLKNILAPVKADLGENIMSSVQLPNSTNDSYIPILSYWKYNDEKHTISGKIVV